MDYHHEPLISIVIPTVHTKTPPPCLESVRLALTKFPHEIIIATDCGLGVSEARNRGLTQASGEYFMLLDDDCLIESAALIQEVIHRSQEAECLHGGVYSLQSPASYWSQVYALVNQLWLELGKKSESQSHLLGGFLFGSKLIKNQLNFDPQLKWGGEEKKLLLRLSLLGIKGKLHQDLSVSHVDNSGFGKMIKRAFLQGMAAGYYDLHTRNIELSLFQSIPFKLLPGLVVFYLFSRLGIFLGKLKSASQTSQNEAETSPTA